MSKYGLKKENVYGHLRRYKFITSSIKKYSNTKKKTTVLDIGCGTGEMITLPIAEEGYNVTGIDIDEKSIKKAKEKNIYSNTSFICGDLKNNLPEKKFDIIICSEVLEHLTNPGETLNELRRLMKKDSLLIITIPNGYGPFEIEKTFLDKSGLRTLGKKIFRKGGKTSDNKITMTENLESRHIQFFTLNRFENMIKDSELIIVEKEKSSFLAGLISGKILGLSQTFIDLNVNKVVRFLPYSLCSGWYFILKKDG